jgi:hypothetical protein
VRLRIIHFWSGSIGSLWVNFSSWTDDVTKFRQPIPEQAHGFFEVIGREPVQLTLCGLLPVWTDCNNPGPVFLLSALGCESRVKHRIMLDADIDAVRVQAFGLLLRLGFKPRLYDSKIPQQTEGACEVRGSGVQFIPDHVFA